MLTSNPEPSTLLPLLPHDPSPNDDLLITDATVDPSPTPTLVPPAPFRKSARDTRPPAYLKDYTCTAVTTASSAATLPGAPYDISQSLSYSHLEPCYQSYLLTISSCPQEPQHFYQAIKDPLLREAMDKEIQALDRNHTWELTTLPPGKSPIGSKWVYKIKLNPYGSVERYKARIVAKGYT